MTSFQDGSIVLQRPTGAAAAAAAAADLRVGTVALSNVAKYWVLTNLFPGPIPQAVYLNHPPGRVGDVKQEIDLSQQIVPTTMEGMTLIHQSTHSQAQVKYICYLLTVVIFE